MNFLKLGDTSHDFLQALIPEFILSRKAKGIQLNINLTDDLDTIRNSTEKILVNEKYKRSEKKFRKSLDTFFSNEEILSYRISCPQFPLRFANGGILPIVRLNGVDYFCFFYRCIFPIGWNIANGASNTQDDLIHTSKIINREFLEELFFFDHKRKLLYCMDPNPNQFATGTFTEALTMWQVTNKKNKIISYKRMPLPIKWINGPDKINVQKDDKSFTTDEVFVNITPKDNAIEVDRIAIINLKDDIVIQDGEVEGILLNRIIGLFEVDKILNSIHKISFTPDRIFYSGKEYPPDEMSRLLEEDYFPRHHKAGIRNIKHDTYFNNLKNKKDLCPITRSLVEKYKTWMKQVNKSIKEANTIQEIKVNKDFEPTVFISYKSEDSEIAIWLYNFFENKGIHAFCSGKSIPLMGESDYARLIDKALDQCMNLVVIGTQPEYFDSGWVSYEWRSFLNEIRSNRKPNGKVIPLTCEVPIEVLPWALRNLQVIPFNKSVPYESFTNLLMYIDRK